jgi:hypothetical protein
MGSDELAEARVVAEDLAYLRDEWQPQLAPAALRRLSPILRKLLVNGHYGRAWRSVGLPGEPWITATDLDAMLGTLDRSLIQLAFAPPGPTVGRVMHAGGQLHLGVPVDIAPGAVVVLIPGYDIGFGPILAAVPPEKVSKIEADPQRVARASIAKELGRRVARGTSLSAFLRSPAALVVNVEVTRQDVISYVANKLGGVHYDPKRSGGGERRLALLDKNLATYAPAQRSEAVVAYAELLSIAEALAESSDAARFMRAFEKAERAASSP